MLGKDANVTLPNLVDVRFASAIAAAPISPWFSRIMPRLISGCDV
jgi:hypothetical protein